MSDDLVGNEARLQRRMLLQVNDCTFISKIYGHIQISNFKESNFEKLKQRYIISNSRTNGRKDDNEKIPYAHRMTLILNEYFELAKSSCHGDYVNPDPNSYKCLYAFQRIKEMIVLHSSLIANGNNLKLYLFFVIIKSYCGKINTVNNGDHDMIIPYMSTLKWIRNLNFTIDNEWRPWYVGGQIARYTEKYKSNQAYITFAR
ncbi:Sinapoylglucose--sinapoylglucose O-sinapoyltransferase [Handroanthus impetiginosus]|uniref:Sinapoylglucose--sinapoylglucose O-sinapoyltransferase n=1 Tax=Handroanthus impetiginosus TaxID=429701 RepID=A0A2G9HLH2_9LAMI|nr:Sinapoylglucose--sinapoylglucose O-sinapoyltransferase [Handroanthus impetiginosus]